MITKKIWYLFILCLLPMKSMQAMNGWFESEGQKIIPPVTLEKISNSLQTIVDQLEALKNSPDHWTDKKNKLTSIVSYTPPEELSKLSPEKLTEYFFPATKRSIEIGTKERIIYHCPYKHYTKLPSPLNIWRASKDCTYTLLPGICPDILRGGCSIKERVQDPIHENISVYTGENIHFHDKKLKWQPNISHEKYFNPVLSLDLVKNESQLNALIDSFIVFFQNKLAPLAAIKEENDKEVAKKDKADADAAERNENFKNTGLKLGTTVVENELKGATITRKAKAESQAQSKEFMKNLPRNAAIGTAGAAVVVTTFALAWHGGHVGFNELQKRLNKPKLIKETTRPENIWQMIVGKDLEESRLDEFVWPDGLQTRLEFLIEQTIQAKEAESSFKNVLLYGPPGTGKTMFAKSLARASGVHYAMFSGADFNNFESLAEAQAELDNIISWGENSDKGLILFVDEADCFLVERTFPDTTPRQCALTNMFLSRVEKPSSNKIMWVFCTNNRGSLDIAVESRISEAYEFKRPSDKNGMQILLQYLEQRDVLITDVMKTEVTKMSSVLVGLSGRDIQEIAEEIARRLNVNNMTLDFDLIKTAIQEKKDNLTAMARAQDEYRRARYGKA